MQYVQHVRGKWIVRVTVPEELRDIIGPRERVEKYLPTDTRMRERLAHGIINGFLARIDAARETCEARKRDPDLTLSVAAKARFASALDADEQKRAYTSKPRRSH